MNTLLLSRVSVGSWFDSIKTIPLIIEQKRIQIHLRIMESVLAMKNVDHLSNELKQERARNINRLRDYWMRGQFPRNTDSPYLRTPFIKDVHRTPCAMAYLIEQSGNRALIDELARSNNHIYIDDVTEGPLIDWLKKSGLTKKEAAMVQPTYGGPYFESIINIAFIVSLFSFVVVFVLMHLGSNEILKAMTFATNKKKILARIYFFLTNVAVALFIITSTWIIFSFLSIY